MLFLAISLRKNKVITALRGVINNKKRCIVNTWEVCWFFSVWMVAWDWLKKDAEVFLVFFLCPMVEQKRVVVLFLWSTVLYGSFQWIGKWYNLWRSSSKIRALGPGCLDHFFRGLKKLCYELTNQTRWWLQIFCIFTPIWEDSHFDWYFSKGLKPPPSKYTQISHEITPVVVWGRILFHHPWNRLIWAFLTTNNKCWDVCCARSNISTKWPSKQPGVMNVPVKQGGGVEISPLAVAGIVSKWCGRF